jgi:hypothetical protein
LVSCCDQGQASYTGVRDLANLDGMTDPNEKGILEPIPGEQAVAGIVPFGLDRDISRQVRAVGRALWQQRDRWPATQRILQKGVCDACPMGPRGLEDDVAPGLHLCARRITSLRDHTMDALAPVELLNIDRLIDLDGDRLKHIGRLPYPFVRRKGGFHRVSWPEALRVGQMAWASVPTEERLWMLGRAQANETAWALLNASDSGGRIIQTGDTMPLEDLEEVLGIAGSTAQLSDILTTDLVLLWGVAPGDLPMLDVLLADAKAQGARVIAINESPVEPDAWSITRPASTLFGTRIVDDQIVCSDPNAVGPFVAHLLGRWGRIDPQPAARDTGGASYGHLEWLAQCVGRANKMVSIARTGARGVGTLHLATSQLGREGTGILAALTHDGIQGARDLGISNGPPEAEAAFLVEPTASAAANIRIHLACHLTPAMLEEGETVVLLPAQGRYECTGGVTTTSLERRTRFSPELVASPYEARPPWQAIQEFAGLEVKDADAIRHELGLSFLTRHGDWHRCP